VPDARSAKIRREVAREVAQLRADSEADALAWIEAVAEFNDEAR
jgi:hypothetical protein